VKNACVGRARGCAKNCDWTQNNREPAQRKKRNEKEERKKRVGELSSTEKSTVGKKTKKNERKIRKRRDAQ